MKENDDILLKALLVCINSKLLSWYGALVLPNLAKDVFPKVNPKDIAQLPISSVLSNNREVVIELAALADKMLSLNSQLQEKRSRFLRRLTENIEGVKITTALQTFDQMDFAGFMAELKKQKIKLTLTQQDEWEDYFRQYADACRQLTDQIAATDREIDLRVYHLYGLTYDEVLTVDPNTTITKLEYENK